MEIPESVKRKATDAISDPETQALLRAFRHNVRDVSPNALFTRRWKPKRREPDLATAQTQALDAVSSPEVKTWIRQIEHDGEIHCPFTPRPANARMAEKVVREYEADRSLYAKHKNITRDHFGMEP
jgi:hypothetical protein